MMGRDFSNESILNLLFRLQRASISRLRGLSFALCRIFSKNSSHKIIFGKYPKFMNSKWIFLHQNVSFGDFLRLECYKSNHDSISIDAKIIIGENTSFGDFVHIGAINKVFIGSNVLGASKILIIDHDHGKGQKYLDSYKNIPPRKRELVSKGTIHIGDNVWIGEGAVILAGSDIGEGAIIAANSIVKGVVPPFNVFTNTVKELNGL